LEANVTSKGLMKNLVSLNLEHMKVCSEKSSRNLNFRGKRAGVKTRRTIAEASSYLALLSSIEPQNVNEACKDECWVKTINEELEQIKRNNTWD